MNRLFRAAAALLAVVAFFPLSASAQNAYDVYIDTDGSTTGCTVALPGGTFAGADRRLQVLATSGAAPQVTSVTLAHCAGGTFGATVPVAGAYPVGINNGVAGSDVIELSAAVASVFQGSTSARFGFAAVGANGSDVLFTNNGTPTGAPIGTNVVYSIPMIGIGGLLLLAALLLVVAKRAGRHRLTLRLLAVGLLLTSGIALAANFVVDGQVGDWAGVPAAANDPAGDASNGAANLDLRAAFIGNENSIEFFRIDVADLQNQAPVATPQAVATNEDTAVAITLASTDLENDPRTYTIVTPPTNGTLGTVTQVPPAGATVQYTPNADFNGSDTFTFRATDAQGAASAPATVTITVNPVNDRPGFTATNPPAANEDAGAQTVASWATFVAGPANESGQAVQAYTVSNVSNAALFATAPAVAANGTLTYTPAANANGTSTFDVVVQDNGGTANGGVDTSLAQTFTITVAAVNDAPTFTAGPNQTVLEDAGAQTVNPWATAITAGPANESGQAVSFNVTNNTNAALFSAGPAVAANGTLTFTPAPDANGVATITLVAQDNGGTANGGVDTSAPQTFTITVTAVNDRPTFVAAPPPPVNEDAGAQSLAGWATFSAGPANESAQAVVGYTVSNVSNTALFATQPAVATNGTLTYTPATNVSGTSTFQVVVQDNGGTANGGLDTSVAQTFTITVNGVNDPPSFTAGPSQTVLEDAGAQTVNPWATAISPGVGEPGQTVAFNVTGNTNAALFSAGPAISPTGVLTYTPAANANGVASITIVAQDDGGTANGGVDTSGPQTFTITVTAVNDRPTLTAANPPAVNEDAGAQSVLAWATFAPGPANEAGQAVLAYTVSNVSNPALFATLPAVANNGTLTYTVAANQSGTSTFDVVVQDNGGTANGGVDTSVTSTFTITVNGINDAPSFTKGPDQTVNEDAGAQTVNPWATAISAGPNEGGQTLTFNVTGNTNAALFSAGPAISPTGVLTYTPAANQFGTANVTITLSDNGGTANGGVDTSAPQTFTITVNPVNDVPSFTAGPNQTVNEDAGAQTVNPWATGLSAGPANESGQTLSFNITNNTNAALFSAAPAVSPTGVLTYTPAANTSGTATITLNIQDNGGTANGGVDTSATQTFTITVNGVNDAPSFTAGANQTVNEDAGAQTVNPWATAISAGPNEGGQTVAFNITGNTNAALFSAGPAVSSTGVLTYTPAADASGVATITLVAQDDGGTANGGVDTSAPQSFTITVNAQNDAPVNTVPATQQIAASGILTLSGANAPSVADVDAGANNVQVTISVPLLANGTFVPAASGATVTGSGTNSVQITGTIANVNAALNGIAYTAPNATAAFTVTMATSDLGNTGAGGAQTDTDTFTINVDQPPTITGTTPANGATNVDPTLDLSVSFSEAVNFVAGNFTVACGGPALPFAIAGNGTNAATINPTSDLTPGTNCTLTINGVGITDVDTVDPAGAIEVGGSLVVSFQTRAVANDDAFTATPNLTLVTPSAAAPNDNGIYANDLLGPAVVTGYGGAGCNLVTPGNTTPTNGGGTVSITTAGVVTYTPPPGARAPATDTFCYQITGNDTATVTITLQNQAAIWFVNATGPGPAPGNGTQANPYKALSSVGTSPLDLAGDTIYIEGAQGCGLTLLNNQKMLGGGSSQNVQTYTGVTAVSGSSLPTMSGTSPTLAGAGGNCITLGQGNDLSGFNIGNSGNANFKIVGTGFGTARVGQVALSNNGGALNLTNGTLNALPTNGNFTSVASNNSGSQGIVLTNVAGTIALGGTTISGSTSQGIFLSGSSNTIDFGATSVTTPGGIGIEVKGHSAGAITFGNTTVSKTSAGIGVDLGSAVAPNAATVTFANLAVTTSNGIAVQGTANTGTVTVTNSTANISATNGAALSFTGPAAGTSTVALNLGSVTSATSTAQGINLVRINGSVTATGGSITDAVGTDVLIDGGTATFTYPGTITDDVGQLVSIANTTGGTKSFSGAITDNFDTDGNGISLSANTGSTITFSGGLSLSTSANAAFVATGGGTVNVCDENPCNPGATGALVNRIATTTATALNVSNTNIGANNLEFRSIASNGGSSNGIILSTTGSAGGLKVRGTGAAGTGGTIANKTGANGSATDGTGVFLNSTSGVDLASMQLNDFQNFAVRGTNVTGFSLSNSVISGANGTTNAGGNEEDSIRFDGLFTSGAFPTAQVVNSTIGGGFTNNIRVRNVSGTLNRLVVNNNTFGLLNAANGNDNVFVTAVPPPPTLATLNVTLTNNTFQGTRADFFESIADGNSTMDVVARQNKFTNGQAIIPGGGVALSVRGDAIGTADNVTFDLSCNRIVGGHSATGIFVAKGNGGGTWSG
ncbi:MAG TPA: tandem-95 repeat protein, partial [Xanthomonadales bacterium]|nr:tandem-95 repeat protein [Xanthomonadales bacterium]